MSDSIAVLSSLPIFGTQAKSVPWDRRRYIRFYGEAFSDATENHHIDVLSGDQPPTVVDGYANWQSVQRPLRRSLRVFTGYEPISLQLSVRFMKFDKHGSWQRDDPAGSALEYDIQVLEWMAGESITVGPSPLVYLSAYGSQGNPVPLIPLYYQSTAAMVIPWVITALSWDTAPIRTANGMRVRQDATVTATMYVAPSGSTRGRGVPRGKAKRIVSAAGRDTALKIARTVKTKDAPETAQLIISSPQNAKLHLRSVNQKIKHGKHVYIPASPGA